MFEPLEIIYASPLLMKVAFTVGLVAAVAFAATFLTMAIMDLRGGSRRMANMVVDVPIGRLAPCPAASLSNHSPLGKAPGAINSSRDREELKPKAEALASAGISTSEAHRCEQLAADR